MSKKMYKNLATALSITATGIQAGVALTKTPFLGGAGRSGLLSLQAAVGGAGVIAIQGSNLPQQTVPASGDASWATILTLNSASKLDQEIEFPRFIRVNITTLGTGTVTIDLTGTQ